MQLDKYCIVGRIIKPHGLDGSLKMLFFSDLAIGQKVLVGESVFSIKKFNKVLDGKSIVRFDGVDSIDQAEKLSKSDVLIVKEVLPNHEIYLDELVNMKVVHKNKHVATIKNVFDFGAGIILDTELDTMISWQHVDKFDKEAKVVTLKDSFEFE
ncbi:MAG: hypothetical protein H6845_01190 [Alphaproteobacteria bacterium]|nr:MAG: hypothetical protein H6845_01190 [Alphaproteobacteria bacterium]